MNKEEHQFNLEDLSYGPSTTAGGIESLSESIRKRAYEIFAKRGSHPGHALDDWLQAEEEVQQGLIL